jgi:hypothetical protein
MSCSSFLCSLILKWDVVIRFVDIGEIVVIQISVFHNTEFVYLWHQRMVNSIVKASSDVTNKRTLYYVKSKIAMTNKYQYLQNEQLHLTLKSLNTKTTMTCGWLIYLLLVLNATFSNIIGEIVVIQISVFHNTEFVYLWHQRMVNSIVKGVCHLLYVNTQIRYMFKFRN